MFRIHTGFRTEKVGLLFLGLLKGTFQKKGNIHHADERIKRSRFVIFTHNLRNIQRKWVIDRFDLNP